MIYTRTKPNPLAIDSLQDEIQESSITISLNNISVNETDVVISFAATLNASEEIELDSILSNHQGISNTETEIEVDSEGRQVSRIAIAKKGWSYLAHFFEYETSKDGSLFCEDYAGVADPSISVKYFNSSNVEIVDAGTYTDKQDHLDNECVKTEIIFKPAFDYELVSGNIRLDTKPVDDCRMWVIGGILELGGPYVKEFARGMNLRYLGADETIQTDGRASKYMVKDITGVPFQANQIKFITKHNVGVKVKIMATLEYFRG